MNRLPSDQQEQQDNAQRTFAAALGVFDDWRASGPSGSNIAEVLGAIAQREVQAEQFMKDVHQSLSESDRLTIYRFFLTAVHRNASIAGQFAPSIVSSPERQAAMWAEYESVSSELDELILSVSEVGVPKPGVAAELLAADFLWSMAWWVHTRRDVLSFLPLTMTSDAHAVWALGRAPDPADQVGSGVYAYAATSEEAYRAGRAKGFEDAGTPSRERESRIATQRRTATQNSNHM